MSININIPRRERVRITRFELFEDADNPVNINYLYTKYKNITFRPPIVSVSPANRIYIYYPPSLKSSETNNDILYIRNSPELYINRYETLAIKYNFTSFSGINIKLFKQQSGNQLTEITNLGFTSSDIKTAQDDTLFVKYFLEDTNIIIGIEITRVGGYVEINMLDIVAYEGDQIEYNDEPDIESYSSIEHTFYNNIVNLSGYPLGPSGLDPSGINQLYYKNISGLNTSSSGLLYKEFTEIDHPHYNNLPAYTNDLVDYSKNIQNNINLKIPQGYIYMLQFILNDITFTNYPSLELTGIYGDFHNQNYFDTGNIYDSITASGTTYATNISGKDIKLYIPPSQSISGTMIDPRNGRNYILKKINIMYQRFHNSMFDFCYNYVDFSGNYLGDSPFVQTLFAPAINNDGSNAKIIFEFIRKHTILHYHSIIINDVIARFVDSTDLQNYYRPEQTDCSISGEIMNQLSIEFLELMRLLCNLDQNQNQLYVTNIDGSGPSGYNTYDIYNPDNYVAYEESGYTVSGIHWGKFFKCSELTPNYSQKIAPIIHYSDIYGNSIAGKTTSGIIENNSYFYFANSRLQNNTISSGQQIRKYIKDYNNKNICAIDKNLFNSYDVSGLLLSHDLLEYTPLVPFVLYEADIYAQGNNLAPNSVGSNIFLKNMFNAIYKSVTDFTDIYIRSKTILFDFINNGLDISGNIIAGRTDDDNVIITVDAVYMRDIIRATHSSYPDLPLQISNPIDVSGPTFGGFHQQYYIFSVSPIFDLNIKKYIQSVGSGGTMIYFYVNEETYLKLKPFSDRLFSTYNNYNYYLTAVNLTPAGVGSLGNSYYLRLQKPTTTPDLPNKKLNLLFFSVIKNI